MQFFPVSRCLLTAGVLSAISLIATPASYAQSNSLFGSNSVSGRTSGYSSMGNSAFGTAGGSSFGSSGMGGMGMSGMGMGGMGNLGSMGGGLGGMGMTGGNRGGSTGFGSMGAAGNTAGGQGNFIGRNTNPNQFIGLNNLTGGNTGNRQQNQQGGGNRNANANNQPNQNPNQSSDRNQMVPLRARQKIAFEFPQPQGDAFHAQVQSRFAKLVRRNTSLRDIVVTTDETGVIVLQGEVATESTARLAEKLVRLEPGVKAVRSELTFPAPSEE